MLDGVRNNQRSVWIDELNRSEVKSDFWFMNVMRQLACEGDRTLIVELIGKRNTHWEWLDKMALILPEAARRQD